MSALPDVEATVNLLKVILSVSEPLDLASEKRRFQGFCRTMRVAPALSRA